MKKLICLILALAVCTVLFAGCGKFDMDNEDLTAYVKLGDITEFTYEEVCRQYEEYREQLAESTTSFSPASGYTLDFLVKAELVGEDDSLTEIEKWTHNSDDDYVKEYDEVVSYFTIGPSIGKEEEVTHLVKQVSMDKLLMESDGIEAVKWAIDSDDYIAALKNEITMVASLKNQSYSEVERILNQNFSNLIKK